MQWRRLGCLLPLLLVHAASLHGAQHNSVYDAKRERVLAAGLLTSAGNKLCLV